MLERKTIQYATFAHYDQWMRLTVKCGWVCIKSYILSSDKVVLIIQRFSVIYCSFGEPGLAFVTTMCNQKFSWLFKNKLHSACWVIHVVLWPLICEHFVTSWLYKRSSTMWVSAKFFLSTDQRWPKMIPKRPLTYICNSLLTSHLVFMNWRCFQSYEK